jgi:hypothetical protein
MYPTSRTTIGMGAPAIATRGWTFPLLLSAHVAPETATGEPIMMHSGSDPFLFFLNNDAFLATTISVWHETEYTMTCSLYMCIVNKDSNMTQLVGYDELASQRSASSEREL